MSKKIRILVADDHAVFRHGLKDILLKNFPGVKIAEVETGLEAIKKVRAADLDLVILDVSMPGLNAAKVVQEIKRSTPSLPILILSMHPEEQYAIRMLRAGATGYISKMKAPLEIVGAIKQVLAGEQYISSTLAKDMLVKVRPRAKELPHEHLSNREFQVLCLIPSGKSLKEIASELSVTIQTVSTHRARILKKMGFHSTSELIRYALEQKLVN